MSATACCCCTHWPNTDCRRETCRWDCHTETCSLDCHIDCHIETCRWDCLIDACRWDCHTETCRWGNTPIVLLASIRINQNVDYLDWQFCLHLNQSHFQYLYQPYCQYLCSAVLLLSISAILLMWQYNNNKLRLSARVSCLMTGWDHQA